MRISLQPAYVIHRRHYRDSSILLDAFTPEYGRVGLVARGARKPSRGASKAALLQPFQPLLLSFSGHSELKTLVAAEPAQPALALSGERLYCGMYVNELVTRLLHRNDAHPVLFAAYSGALEGLVGDTPADNVLRRFELALLQDLGYRLEMAVEAVSRQPVEAGRYYRYDPAIGLIACEQSSAHHEGVFPGSDLLAIASGDLGGPVKSSARRLLRAALAVHLGPQPLRSRELFSSAGRLRPG